MKIPRQALTDFCQNYCNGESELVATVEAAYHWFNLNLEAPQPSAQQVSQEVDEPSIDESLIACLEDDAAKLRDANPDDEMAATMSEAAGRIAALSRTHCASTTTPTGRLSSSAPNLQNIPLNSDEVRRIREVLRQPGRKV